MKYVFFAVLLLSACSTQAIIDTAYPDREKFAFRSADGEHVMTYTCEAATTDTATKKRAKQAHMYFDARFTKAVEGTVNVIVNSEGKVSPFALNRALDKEMEDIVTKTEDRYKCLFTDHREA